jgi:hypothetical protein
MNIVMIQDLKYFAVLCYGKKYHSNFHSFKSRDKF